MRVLAPFLTMVASLTTIFAAFVRMRWTKPTQVKITNEEDYVLVPKAKPWLQTAAKWWLIIVVGGGTVILFVIAAVTIIQLST